MTKLSMNFKKTYTNQIRDRYLKVNRVEKSAIFENIAKYANTAKKQAIRALNTTTSQG